MSAEQDSGTEPGSDAAAPSPQPSTAPLDDVDALARRAAAFAAAGTRLLVGITGAPGAGKSTLARALVERLAPDAVLVPMDGFHLAQAELRRLGIAHQKGAPHTFDPLGYLAMLERIRSRSDSVVYAPAFHRDIEEAIAGAIAVPRSASIVVTEGNYLLLEQEPWDRARALLDQVWYIDGDDAKRRERLVRRHIEFGRTPDAAEAWVRSVDDGNAALIARTRFRADLRLV